MVNDTSRSAPAGPTVLVLGGTGFIGRALVKRLLHDGIGLRALVRDTSGRAECWPVKESNW